MTDISADHGRSPYAQSAVMVRFGMLMRETVAEFKKSIRQPGFVIPSLFFPVAFYAFFAVVMPRGGPEAVREAATYMLATYGVFGAIGPALFGFGIGIATEREMGWLNVKRAAPVPVWVVLAARLLMAAIFAAVISVMLMGVAYLGAGVRQSMSIWMALLALNLLATIPFGLMGLVIGLTVRAQATAAITNVLFLSLSVLGGLWMPIHFFPSVMQKLAFGLPTYHLAHLSLVVADKATGGTPHVGASILYIGVFAAGLSLLAARAWQRMDSDR